MKRGKKRRLVKKIKKVLALIATLVFFTSCAAMDSELFIVPMITALVSLAYVAYYCESSGLNERGYRDVYR